MLLQFRETIYSTVTAMVTPCPWPVDLSRTFVKVVTILNPTKCLVLIDSLELVGSSTNIVETYFVDSSTGQISPERLQVLC